MTLNIPNTVQDFYKLYLGNIDLRKVTIQIVDSLPYTPFWGSKAQGKTLGSDVYLLKSFFGNFNWSDPTQVALLGHELVHACLQFPGWGNWWLIGYLFNSGPWEQEAYQNQSVMEAGYGLYFQKYGVK